MLILRELVGGPRRYGDLRAELPGIATNLLAERLKELQDAGLVDRTDLPAPIGRTVYTLSDMGWQRVLPVLQSVAWFGLDRLDPIDSGPASPLNGFLAGILLGFNPVGAAGLDATYRAEIDGRRFDFAVREGRLAGRSRRTFGDGHRRRGGSRRHPPRGKRSQAQVGDAADQLRRRPA